jgi:protein-S-isoprenylcysteine O-methyltransferase Ste14
MHLVTAIIAAANAALFIIAGLTVFATDRSDATARAKKTGTLALAAGFAGVNVMSIWLTRQGLLQALSADAVFAVSICLFLSASRIARSRRFAYAFTNHVSSELVTAGPYRYIRHPIYTSYLIFGLGCVLAAPAWPQWIILIAMFVVYRNAVYHEEKLLLSRYPDYRAYQERAWRFIPFLY